MSYIKESFKRHSKLYNLIFLIISVSITLGLLVSLGIDKSLSKNIYDYYIEFINNYNSNILSNILYPIIVYISIFLMSLTIIGVFIPFLALFIENMSIGLILGIIIKNIGFKGFLFGSIYFILTKALYLLILIYLTINISKFINTCIMSIKNKKDNTIYNTYSRILLKVLFSILAITAYNLLGIFIIPKIIKLFIFLI